MKKGEDLEGKMCELLRRVALTPEQDFLDKYPHQLSGGQRQRVAIARVLAVEPEVILADEPTGNLDSANGEEVMKLLGQLHESGTTIIMVTHSPAYADYSQRVVHLFDGHIVTENISSEKK